MKLGQQRDGDGVQRRWVNQDGQRLPFGRRQVTESTNAVTCDANGWMTSNWVGMSRTRAIGPPIMASMWARWWVVKGWEKLRRIKKYPPNPTESLPVRPPVASRVIRSTSLA